jgi:Uncharacterized protein conserved in bacteria (DUF2344)
LIPTRDPAQRWRLVVRREPIDPADAGRGQQAAWEASLRRSGLPLAGVDAPGQRPRMATAAPLAAAVQGEAELHDVWLTKRLPRWQVRDALAGVLPPAHTLVDLYDVWLGEPALPGQVVASVYRATIDASRLDAGRIAAAAAEIEAAGSLPRRRTKGDRGVDYDLRPMIERLVVRPDGPSTVVVMTLRHDPAKGVGRPDEVLAELGDRLGATLTGVHLTRERIVLAQVSQPAPATPTRPGPGGRQVRR